MTPHPRSGTLTRVSTADEPFDAFVPAPLPPAPPLALTDDDHDLLNRASTALGRLDGLGFLLPDPHLFVYLWVPKEAVLSSQIEGTQSSLSDLLRHEIAEAPGVPLDDVREVPTTSARTLRPLRPTTAVSEARLKDAAEMARREDEAGGRTAAAHIPSYSLTALGPSGRGRCARRSTSHRRRSRNAGIFRAARDVGSFLKR